MGNEVPKEPLMFLKPPSSIIGPEEAIVLTKYSQRVEHEGELALVIGRRCSQLRDTDDALSWVMGIAASTMSPPATFRKVMFNSLVPRDSIPFARSVRTLKLPRRVKRAGRDARQRHPPPVRRHLADDLCACVSCPLDLPYDDLDARRRHRHRYTRWRRSLAAGDTVEVSVAGIGVLRNPVHAPKRSFTYTSGFR